MKAEPDSGFWRHRPVTVTGGGGFLGRAVVRALEGLGATNVSVVRSREHDLTDADACRAALEGADTVLHLAARVGGIGFIKRNPGTVAHDNMVMGANVFEAARLGGVRKLVCAGSACAYPKRLPVPFRETDLWSGYPDESTAPYGEAKRALLVLSDSYRREHGLDSCAPILTNLYGPGDNYDLEDSHVAAAMVRKFVEAAERREGSVVLWGTGRPTRELLHVDDAARALLLAAEHLDTSEPVNVGTGIPTSIRDLAEMVREISGFEGEIVWDDSMPDGTPERYFDVTRARELIGFEARVPLEEGLRGAVEAYRAAPVENRGAAASP
ncbi:MAG: GDP-L-fucose synthase family protein [Solirubrobacterales bacterium]